MWSKLAPQVALRWRFTDDLLNDSYATFRAVSSVFGALATLALSIAILGLIGMALHVIGRRTHEIGVRKTLGASVRGIVGMLLRDFSKPVVVANLIAWPIAFAAMQVYLNVFVQRIELSPAPFLMSLGFTLLIAWIAVAGQSLRAARMKPARVLRYE